MRTRQDEDNLVPYAEMVEYSLESFLEQIQQGMSKTFYCHHKEVKDIKKQLEEAGLKLWVGLGSRPEIMRSLNLCQKTKKEQKGKEKKVEIRVKVVPEEADLFRVPALPSRRSLASRWSILGRQNQSLPTEC